MTAAVRVCYVCDQRIDPNATTSLTHRCDSDATATSCTHGTVTLNRAWVSARTTTGTPSTCLVCRGSGRATGSRYEQGNCRVCRGRGAV